MVARWPASDLLRDSGHIADLAFMRGVWVYTAIVGKDAFPRGLNEWPIDVKAFFSEGPLVAGLGCVGSVAADGVIEKSTSRSSSSKLRASRVVPGSRSASAVKVLDATKRVSIPVGSVAPASPVGSVGVAVSSAGAVRAAKVAKRVRSPAEKVAHSSPVGSVGAEAGAAARVGTGSATTAFPVGNVGVEARAAAGVVGGSAIASKPRCTRERGSDVAMTARWAMDDCL